MASDLNLNCYYFHIRIEFNVILRASYVICHLRIFFALIPKTNRKQQEKNCIFIWREIKKKSHETVY